MFSRSIRSFQNVTSLFNAIVNLAGPQNNEFPSTTAFIGGNRGHGNKRQTLEKRDISYMNDITKRIRTCVKFSERSENCAPSGLVNFYKMLSGSAL